MNNYKIEIFGKLTKIIFQLLSNKVHTLSVPV